MCRHAVFTVRNRATGQIETINLNDLAAAPVAPAEDAASAAAGHRCSSCVRCSARVDAGAGCSN